MCLTSLRSHSAAALHPHYQEEVEGLQIKDLHCGGAWTG